MKQEYDAIFTTEIATIGIQLEGAQLIKLDYLTRRKSKKPTSKQAQNIRDKIEKYLDAKSKVKDLKIDVKLNVTPFQRKVLKQLALIPYGKTKTYGEIAKKLKTAPRAVGNACRNNPVPIIIPCHRVISANGMGGYSGATDGVMMDVKSQLLKLEGVL
ncbi:MAG: methylated-DNA--[protein]-cysteine S-methyltransferase [Gammaproteobacteria bacterium]|nr:methylated-DNA--[protein]-cysteine S-methyltransferase [Gammaproteobacteria bacterium]